MISTSIALVMFTPRAVASSFFFFNDTATTEIYTLSLHDALPISQPGALPLQRASSLAALPQCGVARFRIVVAERPGLIGLTLGVLEPGSGPGSLARRSVKLQINYK